MIMTVFALKALLIGCLSRRWPLRFRSFKGFRLRLLVCVCLFAFAREGPFFLLKFCLSLHLRA